MVSKKQSQKTYRQGNQDVERLIDVITDKEKIARRQQWIKENLNKSSVNINNLKQRDEKENKSEDYSKS